MQGSVSQRAGEHELHRRPCQEKLGSDGVKVESLEICKLMYKLTGAGEHLEGACRGMEVRKILLVLSCEMKSGS